MSEGSQLPVTPSLKTNGLFSSLWVLRTCACPTLTPPTHTPLNTEINKTLCCPYHVIHTMMARESRGVPEQPGYRGPHNCNSDTLETLTPDCTGGMLDKTDTALSKTLLWGQNWNAHMYYPCYGARMMSMPHTQQEGSRGSSASTAHDCARVPASSPSLCKAKPRPRPPTLGMLP